MWIYSLNLIYFNDKENSFVYCPITFMAVNQFVWLALYDFLTVSWSTGNSVGSTCLLLHQHPAEETNMDQQDQTPYYKDYKVCYISTHL